MRWDANNDLWLCDIIVQHNSHSTGIPDGMLQTFRDYYDYYYYCHHTVLLLLCVVPIDRTKFGGFIIILENIPGWFHVFFDFGGGSSSVLPTTTDALTTSWFVRWRKEGRKESSVSSSCSSVRSSPSPRGPWPTHTHTHTHTHKTEDRQQKTGNTAFESCHVLNWRTCGTTKRDDSTRIETIIQWQSSSRRSPQK